MSTFLGRWWRNREKIAAGVERARAAKKEAKHALTKCASNFKIFNPDLKKNKKSRRRKKSTGNGGKTRALQLLFASVAASASLTGPKMPPPPDKDIRAAMLKVLNDFLRARVPGHVDLTELPGELPEGFLWSLVASELGMTGSWAAHLPRAIQEQPRPGPRLRRLAARGGRPHLPRVRQGESAHGDREHAEEGSKGSLSSECRRWRGGTERATAESDSGERQRRATAESESGEREKKKQLLSQKI